MPTDVHPIDDIDGDLKTARHNLVESDRRLPLVEFHYWNARSVFLASAQIFRESCDRHDRRLAELHVLEKAAGCVLTRADRSEGPTPVLAGSYAPLAT